MNELLQQISQNSSFLLVCLSIIAIIVALAYLAERNPKCKFHRPSETKYVAFIAMFSALSSVIMLLEIPLFFAPPFYQLDFSEVPVLICSFFLGPVAGVLTELIKVILKLFMKGTSTAFVGDFANFIIGCSFVLPASIIYHIHKTRKTAIIGMLVGALIMTIFGSLFNAIYLLPKFSEIYRLPMDAIIAVGQAINPAIGNIYTLVLFAVVPFNIVKGVVVSSITFVLYKRIGHVLFKILHK